ALALWLLGSPDQAVAAAAQATRLAERARHPFSTAFAVLSSVWVRHLRGEVGITLHEAESALAFTTEQGFPSWRAHALVLKGWAESQRGHAPAALADIEEALFTYESTGAKVWQPMFLLLHAQAASEAGLPAKALASVDRALGIAHQMGTYWWTAELLRVKGELLAARGDVPDEAARCFERALFIARNQAARSIELRVLLSQVHHLRQERARQDALDALRGAHAAFTEGFDTADLLRARALLQAGPRRTEAAPLT
ncbi:MAG: hypothetical protein KGJ44_12500, partial [Betaproteobacteria bacterium]|nr:hypothetical protein [Betaproteobacteria bacterium]